MAADIERLDTEASRFRKREALFLATLEKLGAIADGGQYRNDVVTRIERLARVADPDRTGAGSSTTTIGRGRGDREAA